MFDFLDRSEMVFGKEGVQAISNASVCLLGLGGVGSYCAEALVRSGVGRLTIVDKDIVELSNLNRQMVALRSTIGRPKVDVFCERAMDINPNAKIESLNMFYLKRDDIDFTSFDYVADAIDNVTAKIAIAEECESLGISLISAMGCGNRRRPELLKIADIYSTSGCPLCKVMRKELKASNVKKLQVVFSDERPDSNITAKKERTPGSTAFVPAVAGLMMASVIVNELAVKNS